jgi:hypothetical protein
MGGHLEELARVTEQQGHRHVREHEEGRGPRPEAHDHHDRRHDLAHVDEIADEGRDVEAFEGSRRVPRPVEELRDPVQQQEQRDRDAQDQLARVFPRDGGYLYLTVQP